MFDLASSTTLLDITALAKSEIGRIFATLIVFWLSAASIGFLQRRAGTRCLDEQEFARRRGNFVLAKNLILAGAMVVLSIIWASKIAGVAVHLPYKKPLCCAGANADNANDCCISALKRRKDLINSVISSDSM